MKVKSSKERLNQKYKSNSIGQPTYEKKLFKIYSKFKLIEDYFYNITLEKDEKEQKEYINKKYQVIIIKCRVFTELSMRNTPIIKGNIKKYNTFLSII
ncbi:MAG: hypothetical protein ACK5HL_03070 [Bacilli bacterium]